MESQIFEESSKEEEEEQEENEKSSDIGISSWSKK